MVFDDSVIRFESSKPGEPPVQHELPIGGSDPEVAFEGLRRAGRLIADEWEARTPAGTARHHPDLERACYQLILHCLYGEGLIDQLKRLARQHDYAARPLDYPRNRFKLGLDAIFHKVPNQILSDRDRSRLWAAMWYAFRHYIPPALFNGFIHEAGGGEKILKNGVQNIDQSFIAWIVERRVDDTLISPMRGSYPEAIRTAVRLRRHDLRQQPGALVRVLQMVAGRYVRQRR